MGFSFIAFGTGFNAEITQLHLICESKNRFHPVHRMRFFCSTAVDFFDKHLGGIIVFAIKCGHSCEIAASIQLRFQLFDCQIGIISLTFEQLLITKLDPILAQRKIKRQCFPQTTVSIYFRDFIFSKKPCKEFTCRVRVIAYCR